MQISELKRQARGLMRENAPKIFIITAIYLVIVNVIAQLEFRLPGTSIAFEQYTEQLRLGVIRQGLSELYSNFRPSGAALAFVLSLMMPIIEVGYMGCCLKISRGDSGEFKDLFDGFIFFLKIILLSVVMSIFTILWTLLLIFPGIVAALSYSQSYFILIDDPDKGILQCIRESKQMMRGNKLDFFLLRLSFIGWALLDALVSFFIPLPIPFPIISVWLSPYITISVAGFYNRLIRYTPPDMQDLPFNI